MTEAHRLLVDGVERAGLDVGSGRLVDQHHDLAVSSDGRAGRTAGAAQNVGQPVQTKGGQVEHRTGQNARPFLLGDAPQQRPPDPIAQLLGLLFEGTVGNRVERGEVIER